MKLTFNSVLKALSIPLTLLVIYITYTILWRAFGLPSVQELTQLIKHSFDTYGLWIVLGASFIEGLLLLGQYFPGGFVIFLGVISARGDVPRAIEVVLIVDLAFFIAYIVNYVAGKYGWYKLFVKFGLKESMDKAEQKVAKHAFFAFMANYWDTNLASVVATAAGVLKLPFSKFLGYSTIGILVWNTVWGFVVYFVGEFFIDNETIISLAVLLVWCAVIVVKVFYWEKMKIRFGFVREIIE
jgi:membrane protein DedA with SNARE-associated domain